jgi:hypothetical protein
MERFGARDLPSVMFRLRRLIGMIWLSNVWGDTGEMSDPKCKSPGSLFSAAAQ